jgi:hypothetical protein
MRIGHYIAIGAIAAALVLGRYGTTPSPVGAGVFVTDRWTGAVSVCSAAGCHAIP